MPQPDVWLRGPVAGVPGLLQPVAHALLQAREDANGVVPGLTPAQLSARPGGAASAGFHIRHAAGALDRLFTYARGESLSPAQRAALTDEAEVDAGANAATHLLTAFDAGVERALAQLRETRESSLLDARTVGRAQLPSTVLGLLFHAAEHTQRHIGQLIATAKVVRAVEARPSP